MLLFCFFLLLRFSVVFASLLLLLLCLYVFTFSVFCSLLCIFSAFVAFSFSTCFLVVLLDYYKSSYNYMKNSTSSTNNKSSNYKRSNENNARNRSNKNNKNSKRNKNNYNGKGGTSPKLSLCSLGAGAAPSPHALLQLFLFCC